MTALYLAGTIKKDHEQNESYWSPKELEELKNLFGSNEVLFLNPAVRTDDLSDEKAVFGRDMTQVSLADAVLVDARHRRGLGVGAEMMWAKMNGIPVISWAPNQSHYRRTGAALLGVAIEKYVHPFVASLSDFVAHDLKEAVQWILNSPEEIKGPESIHEAMTHYATTQFANDKPMQELAIKLDALRQPLETGN